MAISEIMTMMPDNLPQGLWEKHRKIGFNYKLGPNKKS